MRIPATTLLNCPRGSTAAFSLRTHFKLTSYSSTPSKHFSASTCYLSPSSIFPARSTLFSSEVKALSRRQTFQASFATILLRAPLVTCAPLGSRPSSLQLSFLCRRHICQQTLRIMSSSDDDMPLASFKPRTNGVNGGKSAVATISSVVR